MKKQLQLFLREHLFYKIAYSNVANQFEYFRIGIALFSIFSFLSFWLDYDLLLVPDGIINWEVTNASAYWFEPHLLKVSEIIGLAPMTTLYLVSFLYLASLVLLALGLHTRLAAIVALLLFLTLSVNLSPFLYGVDLYQNVFLLFLCVFPSGYACSIRPLPITKAIQNSQQIGIRTIQLYLGLTYLSAGLGKAKMASWHNGEFLFLSISDPNYELFSFPDTLPAIFYASIGILVVTLELFYLLLVFLPYIRSFLVISIVGMHLFIVLFMGLVPFGVLLALVNIIAWYPLLKKDYSTLHQSIISKFPRLLATNYS